MEWNENKNKNKNKEEYDKNLYDMYYKIKIFIS